MALFSKKRKEVTMRIYKSNQQAQFSDLEASAELIEPEEQPILTQQDEEGLWERCANCHNVLYTEDLEPNLNVCPSCNHHFRLSARQRIAYTADEGSFVEFNKNVVGQNPLGFPGYEEKLEKMRAKVNEKEAMVTGECTIEGLPCVLAVMDGYFMMGSMGAAVGEKFALAVERALQKKLPLIAFTVSGGARMQESLMSLMQMSKSAAVLAKLDEAKLPYIVVLTDPTTGGVTASFGMLGDITLAEPNAVVGFAGRRVIEQTIKQELPSNFQTAEFVMKKGFIDRIVPRKEMRHTLYLILEMHKGAGHGA